MSLTSPVFDVQSDPEPLAEHQPDTSISARQATRRWWLILPCGVVGLIAGLAATACTDPLYRSQVVLTSASVTDLSSGRDTLHNTAFQDRVAAGLRTLPHPDIIPRTPWLSHLTGATAATPAPYAKVLADTSRRTQLQLTPTSLQLTCESIDAGLSATWCNALANNLLNVKPAESQNDAQPAQSSAPAPTGYRLYNLEQAILEVQAAERAQTAAGNATAYAASRHREMLLQLSFDTALQTIPASQRQAAQDRLLHRETESFNQSAAAQTGAVQTASPHTASAQARLHIAQPAIDSSEPMPPAPLPRALAGTSLGVLFGGLLALSLPRRQLVPKPQPGPYLLHFDYETSLPAPKPIPLPRSFGDVPDLTDFVTTGLYDPFQILGFSLLLEEWNGRDPSREDLLAGQTTNALRTYAITSPHPAAGKTLIAANLGIALSRTQLRTLLIDANFENPALHNPFELRNLSGLAYLLSSQVQPTRDLLIGFTQRTSYLELSLLTVGRLETQVNTAAFAEILSVLSSDFDLVLVDLPSLESPESLLIAAQCQATLLILPTGADSPQDIRPSLETLAAHNIHLSGTATNHLPKAL